MADYSLFRADCWTINHNFESSACITSQTDDEFTIDGTFRTRGDLVGIFWNSVDPIEHTAIKYPTVTDYTDVILSFDFTSDKCTLVGKSDLSITTGSGRIYFVKFENLSSTFISNTDTIPSGVSSFTTSEFNVLSDGIVVKDNNNNTLSGFVDMDIEAVLDKANKKLHLYKSIAGTFSFYEYCNEICETVTGFNQKNNYEKFLVNDKAFENRIRVTTTGGTLLTHTTDYTYDPDSNKITAISERCKNGCKVYYIPQPLKQIEVGVVNTSETFTNLTVGTKIQLNHNLVDARNIRGWLYTNASGDYVYDSPNHELQILTSNCIGGTISYNNNLVTLNIPNNSNVNDEIELQNITDTNSIVVKDSNDNILLKDDPVPQNVNIPNNSNVNDEIQLLSGADENSIVVKDSNNNILLKDDPIPTTVNIGSNASVNDEIQLLSGADTNSIVVKDSEDNILPTYEESDTAEGNITISNADIGSKITLPETTNIDGGVLYAWGFDITYPNGERASSLPREPEGEFYNVGGGYWFECSVDGTVSYIPNNATRTTEILPQNNNMNRVALQGTNIIDDTIQVYDLNDNLLSIGDDYVIYPGEIEPVSQTCANGCKVSYIQDIPANRTTSSLPANEEFDLNNVIVKTFEFIPNGISVHIEEHLKYLIIGYDIVPGCTISYTYKGMDYNYSYDDSTKKLTILNSNCIGGSINYNNIIHNYSYDDSNKKLTILHNNCIGGSINYNNIVPNYSYDNNTKKLTILHNNCIGGIVEYSGADNIVTENISSTAHVGDVFTVNTGTPTSIVVKDGNNNTLTLGSLVDYQYYPRTNEFKPTSERCAEYCQIRYTDTQTVNTIQLLPNIHEGTLYVTKTTTITENNETRTVNENLVEGTDFTVNYTTGVFTPLTNKCNGAWLSYHHSGMYQKKTQQITSNSTVVDINAVNDIYVQLDDKNRPNRNQLSLKDANNKYADVVVLDDADYIFDTSICTLYPLNNSLASGGSIKYDISGSLTIDFNNLIAKGYKQYGMEVNEDVEVPVDDITEIMIPLVPMDYVEDNYVIINNRDFRLEVTNISVTNNHVTSEQPFDINHPFRLAEGYDDDYHLCPRRLAYSMSKLKYREWLDVYIGASHYYEKTGTIGNTSRPVDPDTVTYNTMTTDTSVGLNKAFETWWNDYCKWSKSYGMNNIIASISLENLQMPDSWKQRLPDGTPGKTGWTPATSFFSPCNSSVRTYIRLVAEACLDILVDNGLPPILQWGEPWWWWQEGYPEAISIDPNNQNTNTEKYPGQPPAFYDDATKQKYKSEHDGADIPIYTSSWDDYDPDVIEWLRLQLVDYNNFMKSIVKNTNKYNDGIYTVLFFPPSVLDEDRVPPMMQKVNFLQDAWSAGNIDFIELEDYDWVISEDPQHGTIYSMGWNFFRLQDSTTHYYGGYVQYPKNAEREWALIVDAIDDAYNFGIGQVFVWAGTQIRRDNIMLTYPQPKQEALPEVDSETNNPLNLIVLHGDETLLTWLDVDKAKIIETNSKNSCRKIEITYPYENKIIQEDTDLWYEQGNKIFVPSQNGISACLYVINTEYEIDFWKENTITVTAEEVLCELNYDVISFKSNSNYKITSGQLEEWFSDYYEIGIIDAMTNNRRQVTPEGVMTYMSLLRLIEEQTERVFITSYTNEDNIIKRKLSLRDTSGLRYIAKTETLDLNYNMDSLEFTKSEENCYMGMAPKLKNSTSVNAETVSSNTVSSELINVAENNLNENILYGADTGESKSYDQILEEWLDYEVMTGQQVPMILQKDDEGNLVTTATWNAPFTKEKGKLYIYNEGTTRSNYSAISKYQPELVQKVYPKLKIGTVETSETVVQSIYNVLANSLLNKLNPQFELKIDVKDIQLLLGLNSLGYSLHETLQVKVPNFNYYVPCVITETKKNLHHPGENTIKINTEVVSMTLLDEVTIESETQIISANETLKELGGLLLSDNEGLPDSYVTITVTLQEVYSDTDSPLTIDEISQIYYKFDPYENIYVFSNEQINNLEAAMRNDQLDNKPAFGLKDEYRLKDITGKVYSVPWDWCEAIYYASNQFYIENEEMTGALGGGYFDETVTVHSEKGASDTWTNKKVAYERSMWVACFYDYYQKLEKNYIELTGTSESNYYHLSLSGTTFGVIGSSENQNGGTCGPSAISNCSALLYNYYTEADVVRITGINPATGINMDDIVPSLEKMGFKGTIVKATYENIKKYIKNKQAGILIGVDSTKLCVEGYYDGHYIGTGMSNAHMLLLFDWIIDKNGFLRVAVLDSNIPIFEPIYNYIHTLGYPQAPGIEFRDMYVRADILIDAITGYYHESLGWLRIDSSHTPNMIVMENTKSNYAKVVDANSLQVNPDGFSPEIKTYNINSSELENKLTDDVNSPLKTRYGRTSISYVLKFRSGSSYLVTGYWVRALCLAAMYNYMDHAEKTKDLSVYAGRDSYSMKYYQHMDTTDNVGSMDWFTPCVPRTVGYMYAYSISTVLFFMGYLRSYYDFISNKDYVNFMDIYEAINSVDSKIHLILAKATSENISKYLDTGVKRDNFMYTVILTYAMSNDIRSTNVLELSYSPVMLFNKDGTNVDYLNIGGSGNNVFYEYDTLATDTKNPYKRASISDMVSWIDNASDLVLDGDDNMMLVVSWHPMNYWNEEE